MDTMTGVTTRDITFGARSSDKVVRDFRKVPAGTEVDVSERRDGWLTVRLPGTLFTQVVDGSSVVPA